MVHATLNSQICPTYASVCFRVKQKLAQAPHSGFQYIALQTAHTTLYTRAVNPPPPSRPQLSREVGGGGEDGEVEEGLEHAAPP